MTLVARLFPKRVPYLPQMEAVECGAASLAMILAYHGHHAPLVEVRQACAVGRDGTSAEGILRAARAYHLEAEAVQVALEHLHDLPVPAILHWGFNHFVVLERLTSRGAILVDPADGRRHASRAELDHYFTGVALAFAPDDPFVPRPQVRPSLDKYRDLLKEALPLLGQVAGHSLLLLLLALVPAMASQFLLDRIVIPKQETWLIGLAAVLMGTWLSRTLLTLVRSYVVQGLQVHMDIQLMHRFMGYMLKLPLGFFLQRRTGDLMQRAASLSSLRTFFTSRTVSALLDGVQLLGFGILMVAWQPLLGTLLLALAAARVGLAAGMRTWLRQIMAAELAATGREQAVLMECLSALETIKASQAEGRMVERWTGRMVDRANASLRRRKLELWTSGAMGLFQAGSLALITWVGGRAVVEDRMTMGVYAAFMALQAMVTAPLESLLTAFSQIQYLGTHLLRLDDVLETPREAEGGEDPGRLAGEIELEAVSFRYNPGSPWAVEDVSLHIRPGEKIALVGPSGAGKSTLARLLMGMHLPERGTICFDGRPLASLDLERLRNQMGVVLQDTFLFDDTVRANLSLNDTDLDLPRLRQAAAQACLLEVIESLPQGFEAPVGENGSRLSGGQRQRLSLARALAHDPAILLLDEATSALDLETEVRLHANLAARGCTRLVIAHRLATVKDADRILVLDQGRIVQQGTYAALAQAPGLFRQLVQAMEEAHGF